MRIFNEENKKPEVVLILNKSEINCLIEVLTEASQKYKRRTNYKKMLEFINEKVCVF